MFRFQFKKYTYMSKERRQAGRAAWPRRAFGFHVQFFFPYNRFLLILYRIIIEQQLQIGKWLHPSQRHKPNQIPILVDLLLNRIENRIVILKIKNKNTYPDLIHRQNILGK